MVVSDVCRWMMDVCRRSIGGWLYRSILIFLCRALHVCLLHLFDSNEFLSHRLLLGVDLLHHVFACWEVPHMWNLHEVHLLLCHVFLFLLHNFRDGDKKFICFWLTQITLRSELLSQIRDLVVVLRDWIHKELGNLINLIKLIKLDWLLLYVKDRFVSKLIARLIDWVFGT